jgi:hypothetical protein
MQTLSNGRVRRAPAEWRELVERFSGSGLSQREFCRREKLNVESFHRWYRRLTAPEQGEFVEVRPPATEDRASSSWAVEVELANGTIVRIGS